MTRIEDRETRKHKWFRVNLSHHCEWYSNGFSLHVEKNLNSSLWPSAPCMTWPPACLPLWSHLLSLSFHLPQSGFSGSHSNLPACQAYSHLKSCALTVLFEMLFLHIIRLSHFHFSVSASYNNCSERPFQTILVKEVSFTQ